MARHLPAVCLQQLPDVTMQGSVKMSRGRYKQLTRLLPYLKTESEDCLYLNVYVPRVGKFNYIPFHIHIQVHGYSALYACNAMNIYRSLSLTCRHVRALIALPTPVLRIVCQCIDTFFSHIIRLPIHLTM